MTKKQKNKKKTNSVQIFVKFSSIFVAIIFFDADSERFGKHVATVAEIFAVGFRTTIVSESFGKRRYTVPDGVAENTNQQSVRRRCVSVIFGFGFLDDIVSFF